MRNISAFFLMFAAAASLCMADDQPGNLISTPGVATIDVSPDRLEIDFELLTEEDTFSGAAEAAREMATRLQGISHANCGIAVSVESDLTFMKLKKWGKGRKLEHTFRMEVGNVPDGKAQEVLVDVVESALALDSELTVKNFTTLLSKSRTEVIHLQLLNEAVEDARANATVLAEAAGLNLGSPRRIVAGLGEWQPGTRSFDSNGARFYRRSQPFTVSQKLASRIHVSVGIVVEFEVEPL